MFTLSSGPSQTVYKFFSSVFCQPPTSVAPVGSSYLKKTNDLSLCDSLDRWEADVNPRQIKSYCVACIVYGRSKGWERGLSCCSPQGFVCNSLWIVPPGWCVLRLERSLLLSEVTWCYNSHTLPLHLPPRLCPQLTFWIYKSSTDKKS